MTFVSARPFTDPAAARKLIEIANSIEALQDGRGSAFPGRLACPLDLGSSQKISA